MLDVILKPQVVGFSCFQQGIDNGRGFCPIRGIGEQPTLTTYHEWPDRILHMFVTDLDFAMIEEGAEVLLLIQGIVLCFLQLANGVRDCLYLDIVFFNDCNGFPLALLLPL